MTTRQRNWLEAVIGLLILAAIGIVWAAIDSWACHQRWLRSGLSTTWGLGQGCLVQTPNGRWIPDDRVRDVDLEPRDKTPPPKPTNLT
jgi:hypothetical protein